MTTGDDVLRCYPNTMCGAHSHHAHQTRHRSLSERGFPGPARTYSYSLLRTRTAIWGLGERPGLALRGNPHHLLYEEDPQQHYVYRVNKYRTALCVPRKQTKNCSLFAGARGASLATTGAGGVLLRLWAKLTRL